MKRAWRTTLHGLTSLVVAETRGRAIAITLRSARKAGFSSKWQQVRATRAPEYDAWAEVESAGIAWNPICLPAP